MSAYDDREELRAGLERLPLVGRVLADSFEAWTGLADAMNLGALRSVLDAETAPSPSAAPPASPEPREGRPEVSGAVADADTDVGTDVGTDVDTSADQAA